MSLTQDHGDHVFQCDSCGETLETNTSNFDSARNALKRAHWKPHKNPQNEWRHYCPQCQGGLL